MHNEITSQFKTSPRPFVPMIEEMPSPAKSKLPLDRIRRMKAHIPRGAVVTGFKETDSLWGFLSYIHNGKQYKAFLRDNRRNRQQIELTQVEIDNLSV